MSEADEKLIGLQDFSLELEDVDRIHFAHVTSSGGLL
jgi:hypothetical protein